MLISSTSTSSEDVIEEEKDSGIGAFFTIMKSN